MNRVCSWVMAALLFTAASGCAKPPPYGVETRDVRAAHRQLTQNVLTNGQPSTASRQVMERLGLFKPFEKDPARALQTLHEGLAPGDDQDRLFALAELSFLHGESVDDPQYSLGAAVYAYAFLFPGETGERPLPFDPRFRLACELYNRGLTAGLSTAGDDGVRLEGRTLPLPFGTLTMSSSASDYRWAGFALDHLVPSANYAVRGFRNRYRHAGLGAPLAASLEDPGEGEPAPPGHAYIPPRMRLNISAFLRLENPREALAGDTITGTLELYAPEDAHSVEVNGRRIPLEFETTLPLALTLERSRLWDFERKGLRSGDMSILKDVGNLVMLRPYRRGRIPVVLVHGTGSSAGRWAQLINELENDIRIRDRYQIFLFSYNSDNPIAVSGGELRTALTKAIAALDPSGRDPMMKRMVVVGHSQGGLLAKLTAVDSGERFWNMLSDVPISELGLQPDTRELLETSLFVKPHPNVARLIFMATPHRGSYLTRVRLAGWSPSGFVAGLIKLPRTVTQSVTEVASAIVLRDPDARYRLKLDRIPTSIDNMTPGNPFLQTLADLPLADGVKAHSIVAVEGDGPPSEGGDGVVKYTSAHLDGVESELVVRASHSMQDEPESIEEVRRILLLHAEPDL